MVRDSREHPDVRTGSSVRGAIDVAMVARELAALAGCDVLDPAVTLDAAQLALSGRIRLREGCGRRAEEVVTELWRRHFEPSPAAGDDAAPDAAAEGAPPGKAEPTARWGSATGARPGGRGRRCRSSRGRGVTADHLTAGAVPP